MTQPSEFAGSAPTRIDSVRVWTDELRRIEDLGFASVVVADHFTDGRRKRSALM